MAPFELLFAVGVTILISLPCSEEDREVLLWMVSVLNTGNNSDYITIAAFAAGGDQTFNTSKIPLNGSALLT